ncbi:MAG: helix-turn-helix domain-containing protein [Ruminiclostridium sp.]|nr:helix-turn-helix domain-containing protein [Ruminiclostridium sp.]
MAIGEKIKYLREQAKISQTELAEKVNTTKQNIYKYEKGIITNIPSDRIELIANALNTTPAYLMGWEEDIYDSEINLSRFSNIKPVKKIKLPMLGKIACGKPIFAEEEHEAFVEVDDSYGADFCLSAEGDSMINAGIDSGDTVLIREAPIVDNGQIAAVIIDDEATLKRVYYYKDKNKLVLQAENPRYEPLVFINEELNTIRILGKAVAVIKRL